MILGVRDTHVHKHIILALNSMKENQFIAAVFRYNVHALINTNHLKWSCIIYSFDFDLIRQDKFSFATILY